MARPRQKLHTLLNFLQSFRCPNINPDPAVDFATDLIFRHGLLQQRDHGHWLDRQSRKQISVHHTNPAEG